MTKAATPNTGEMRRALGMRLRDLRTRARLSGAELARRAGWPQSKISKIELGQQAITTADITAWCEVCSAPDEVADLRAATENLDGLYVEHKRTRETGLRRTQEELNNKYVTTRVLRVYEPGVIPGIFQTPEYAWARMNRIGEFMNLPDDIDEAVTARMGRQELLRRTGRRFLVVIEEWALYARIGTVNMMIGQLGQLLAATTLPAVSLGIIPLVAERTMWGPPGFWLHDDTRATIETLTASVTVTQPAEIDVYLRAHSELTRMAVHGVKARELITRAIDALGSHDS